MPQINYNISGDESLTWRTIAFDEDPDWWSGVQKVGATIALAVTIAAASLSAAQAQTVTNSFQDEPPVAPADEVYWQQGPPLPIQAILYQRLPYLPDPEEIPAGNLSAPPDELYWQLGPRPILASLLCPNPFIFEQHEAIWSPANEDYWQQGVLFAPSNVLFQNWLFDQNEIVQQPIIFQPDEDYWQNPIIPIPNYSASLVFHDDDLIFSQSAVFSPDEDYWYVISSSTLNSNFQSLPYFYDSSSDTVALRANFVFVSWIQEDDS